MNRAEMYCDAYFKGNTPEERAVRAEFMRVFDANLAQGLDEKEALLRTKEQFGSLSQRLKELQTQRQIRKGKRQNIVRKVKAVILMVGALATTVLLLMQVVFYIAFIPLLLSAVAVECWILIAALKNKHSN